MTTQEKIEVMKAYADGKKIQRRVIGHKEWFEWNLDSEPVWNWDAVEFRIKPEEKYRPYKNTDEFVDEYIRITGFALSEYVKPLIWVKNKQSGDVYAITGYFGGYVKVSDEVITLAALCTRFTYLDGSPCGMKETD